MKPYPSYKDSGQPWLGAIPTHWRTAPTFVVLREQHVLNTGLRQKTLLSLSYGRVVVKDIESTFGLLPASFETYQIVEPGNIILRFTDLQNDHKSLRVGLVKNKGIITSAYLCLSASQSLLPKYGYQQLHAIDNQKLFYSMGGGLRQSMGYDDLRRMAFLIPPIDEQSAIVAYLDRKTSDIERFITKKRQLIALLNEQKAAIINRAVTKGLNPDVPMKASGVEWLEGIPVHWDVLPLKRRWTVTDCKHLTVDFVDEGIPIASIGEVKGMRLNLSSAKRTTEDGYLKLIDGNRKPHLGDVIYSRNATVGEAAYVDTDATFCMGQDVSLIRSKAENQQFLVYQLRSPSVMYQLEQLMIGSTFRRINVSDIKMLVLCCPPLNEQHEIVHALDSDLQGFHDAISKAEREIELIIEYQMTLISDAVTGKIDVREVAEADDALQEGTWND